MYVASFPGLPTVQFVIACSVQKQAFPLRFCDQKLDGEKALASYPGPTPKIGNIMYYVMPAWQTLYRLGTPLGNPQLCDIRYFRIEKHKCMVKHICAEQKRRFFAEPLNLFIIIKNARLPSGTSPREGRAGVSPLQTAAEKCSAN